MEDGKIFSEMIFLASFQFSYFAACRWEGTAIESGQTGWFPSNYVSEYKATPPAASSDAMRTPEEIQAFRNVIYNDLLESERAHCA